MKTILLAILTASFMATTATCDVTFTTSGSITVVGPDFVDGKARFFIQQRSTTTAAVRFAGSSPGDAIYQIYVLPRRVSDGIISRIGISFSEVDGSQTVLDAVERITVENPSTTKVEIINFNITGDVGAPGTVIDVAGMTYIDAGGDMYADVIVHDRVDSGSTPTNEITIGGSWLGGGFYQNSGLIDDVNIGGDISGSSLNPIEIWSKTSIGPISAASITNARIGSQTNGFSGFSAVTSITTTSGDFVSSAPMTMASLGSMDINGDFDADITLNGPMPSATSLYRIDDSFASTAVLSLPANGLLGSILINTDNASGQFLGDIEVGSTVLNPNYTTLSSALGGGATGRAPYNFHQFTGPAPLDRDELSCNPHHLESFQVGECGDLPSLDEVIIDHYGPIYAVRDTPQDTAPQFRVEFLTAIQPLPNGTPWADVTDLFMVDFTRTSDDNDSTNRKAYLVPSGVNKSGFNAAGIFRIRPITNRVKSAGVAGFPNVAYDSNVVSGDLGSTTTTQYDWYQFKVGFVVCPGSRMFEGGQVSSTDLAAWLDEPFEVNMDGETCPQDFDMMLNAYQP